MSLPFAVVPVLLSFSLALPRRRDALFGAVGFLPFALAVSSLSIVLGDGTAGGLAAAAAAGAAGQGYLVVNASLMALGCFVAGVGIARAWRAGARGPAGVAAMALVMAVAWSWPLLRVGRVAVAVPAGAVGAGLVVLAEAWLAGRARPDWTSLRALWRERRAGAALAWALVLLALAGAVVPSFGMALLIAAAALCVAWYLVPARGPVDRVPVAAVAAVLLVAVAFVAWKVAGPVGLGLRGLADAPFSPALQVALVAALLPACFVVAGVPPFDRFVPGAALAPLAAAIVAHGVVPGFADGVEHWRSAAALWLVLAAVAAGWRHRLGPLAASAALFALLVGAWAAAIAGIVLALVASAADLLPVLGRRVPEAGGRALWALALLAWYVALRATLPVEVVYSVAMTAVLAGGVLRAAGEPGALPAA